MRILVTGGAGFIGSHLADELVRRQHTVTVVDNLSHGRRDNIAAPRHSYTFIKADIRHDLGRIFKRTKPEVVFHLAAQIDLRFSLKQPRHDAEINIGGSINVLEQSVIAGVKQVIFTSTGGAIYGPTNILPTTEA